MKLGPGVEVMMLNHNKITLPTKKENLKILFLEPLLISPFTKQISEELELNIEFEYDNTSSLEKNVKNHLGDYDIIIASRIYSSKLLSMNNESTQQCKNTGKELTLLVVYQSFKRLVKLSYSYGGSLAPDSDYHIKKFGVLGFSDQFEKNRENEYYEKSSYNYMKSIIEASVNLYNEVLIEKKKTPITDLDLKSAEQFDREYCSHMKEMDQISKSLNLKPKKDIEVKRN